MVSSDEKQTQKGSGLDHKCNGPSECELCRARQRISVGAHVRVHWTCFEGEVVELRSSPWPIGVRVENSGTTPWVGFYKTKDCEVMPVAK